MTTDEFKIKELLPEQRVELLSELKTRFEKNMNPLLTDEEYN